MKFSFITFCFLLINTANIFAQRTITGKVVDASNGQPVVASAFLSNTSIGTTSSGNGYFELRIPEGRYDLIVSSVGYETFVLSVQSAANTENLIVKLKPKVKELENVRLEPYEKDGWEKWGQFFLDNFIGRNEYSKDCKIENYHIIKFRNSRVNNELTAHAFEPLIIVNEALGYKIIYQFEEFTYTYKDKYIFFSGYPLFVPLEGNQRKQKRWAKERDDVYFGSQMHFMRSLYRNNLVEEGFELKKLVKVQNEEKQRIRKMFREAALNGGSFVLRTNKDSSAYYDKILAQPESYDVLHDKIIPADSVAFAYDSTTAGLEFDNYLWVRYKNADTPSAYRSNTGDKSGAMISTLFLLQPGPLQIQSNGNYFPPRNLLSGGYWAWSEKIARMLPFNFKPNKKAP